MKRLKGVEYFPAKTGLRIGGTIVIWNDLEKKLEKSKRKRKTVKTDLGVGSERFKKRFENEEAEVFLKNLKRGKRK